MQLSLGRRWVAAAILAGMLAACQSEPPRPRYPEITFTELAPMRLDVARIDVVNEYVPPLKPPNIEQEFPVNIAAVAERWAHDRLRAVGSTGSARVVIKDASAVETDLRKTPGLKGMFTTDQASRFTSRVAMAVEVRNDHGFKDAAAEASATRTRTLPENATLNDRDQLFFDMTEAMMRDVDAELEKNIRAYMGRFLR